jgi:rod shape-determining protein MreD
MEATVLPYVRVGNAQPDLILLVVAVWSLRRGVEEGAVWAFVGGIVLDLLSAGPAVAHTLALLAVSLVLGIDPSTGLGRRQTQPIGENPFVLILGVVFGTLVYHLVLLTASQLVGYPVDWLDAATRVVAPRLLFNAILMPIIFQLLAWFDRRTRREEYVL